MAVEKKPSIYQDRGTIGSVRELDEYGVWVKSEPQDLVDDDKDAVEGFSLDSLDDLPDFPADIDASSGSADLDFSIPEDDLNPEDESESGVFSFESGDLSAGEAGDFSLRDEGSVSELSLNNDDDDFSLSDTADEDILSVDAVLSGDNAKNNNAESSVPEGEDFDEISLEDLLGDVTDQLSGEDVQEEAGSPAKDRTKDSSDKSTQLLMKIAEELSSIRAELNALKQEFSAARGTEGGESHGFFDTDADADDKIALTGDELDNILSTAKFTEESGVNAAAEDLASDFSDEEAPAAPLDVSPQVESADELSLDDLDILEEPAEEVEFSPGLEEAPIEVGELSETGQLDELGTEGAEDLELSLVDLSDDSITADFSVENAESDILGDDDRGAAEFSPADSEIILEESPEKDETEDAKEPDVSLDTSFWDEEISLENFGEEALDLSGAVIDEPNLGAEIKENPLLEPALDDIAVFEEGLDESGGDLSPEAEVPLEFPEGPAVETLEESELPPLEETGDETEIFFETEKAAEISPAGGGLDQIIPEGFVVEGLDDEGEADFGALGGPGEMAELPKKGGARGTGIDGLDETVSALPGNFKVELKQVLSYMDQLLESLPDEKIEEFAKSEYFDVYKKLFKELGLV
jgi:hypothetical protein